MMSTSRMTTVMLLRSCSSRAFSKSKRRVPPPWKSHPLRKEHNESGIAPRPAKRDIQQNSIEHGGGSNTAGGGQGGTEGRPTSAWRRFLGNKTAVNTTIVCIVVAITTRTFIEICQTEGPSMEPTIPYKSYVLVNKFNRPKGIGNTKVVIGNSGDVARGSLVLTSNPMEEGRSFIVKRVTGIAGDRIQVQPPAADIHNMGRIETRVVVVPEGCYFLEGDNEMASVDSRVFGPMHGTWIRGVVFWMLWPRFGPLGRQRPEPSLLDRTPPSTSDPELAT